MVTTDIQCHLINKVVRLIRGGKRVRGKKPGRISKASTTWLRVSSHLMDTECEFAPCDGPAPVVLPDVSVLTKLSQQVPESHIQNRRSNTVESNLGEQTRYADTHSGLT